MNPSPSFQKKVEEVEKLISIFNKAKIVILTEYRGLNAIEITELRRKLRETGTNYKVSKNTFAKRAFKEISKTGEDNNIDKLLTGPVALAFNFDDPVIPAKVLKDFSKEHENLKIKGGILGTRVLKADEVITIASLPSRGVLITMAVTGMKSPINNLVFTLKGIISKLVYVLESVKKQKYRNDKQIE